MGVRQDFSYFVGEDFTYIDNVPASNMMVPSLWSTALKIWNQQNGTVLQTILGTILDPNNAQAIIAAAVSIGMGAGEFWYTFERIDPGAAKVLTYGNLILKPKPPIFVP